MKEPHTIVALLITKAFVPRADLPELQDHLTFNDVERRLRECGMELVDSGFLADYCIRPTQDARLSITDQPATERMLDRDAAMLVIMWAKLSLPRHSQAPGPYRIMQETIKEEFGDKFGSKENLAQALGRLETLGFLRYADGFWEAGPYMEAGMDHKQLWQYVEGRTILQGAANAAIAMVDTRGISVHEAVRVFFDGTKERLAPRDVAKLLNLDPGEVLEALRDLKKSGVFDSAGPGKAVRYWRV